MIRERWSARAVFIRCNSPASAQAKPKHPYTLTQFLKNFSNRVKRVTTPTALITRLLNRRTLA